MAGEGDEKQPPPEIICLVGENDVNGVKNLLLKGEAKTEETDANGMTALHHAAYKGNAELCKLLIDHDADVNSDSHDHRYSPLHFAALSGSTATVQHLLTAGSKTYYTNTLGRTAAQMAAFVGNHAVVALINNYVPVDDVMYYTKPTGLEKEAKLPAAVAKQLYDLIMQVSLHPVRIAMRVEKSEEIRKHIEKVYKVLELMCEKENKRQEGVNEVLCIKFHYLAYVLKTLEKEMKKYDTSKEKDSSDKDFPMFESIIKKWLRGREYDGIEEHLEYYVRDAIKAFPYVEMPLFIQLVRNITGKLGDSWALGVLSGCINGQRAFQDEKTCSTCGEEKKDAKKCSKCKMVQYCDRTCQKLHWTNHKKFCSRLLEEYEKKEKSLAEERKKEEEEKKTSEAQRKPEESAPPNNKDLTSQTEKLEIS